MVHHLRLLCDVGRDRVIDSVRYRDVSFCCGAKEMKELVAYLLIISFGIILLLHFILIWIWGGVWIYEHSRINLFLESMMSIAIIILGIERALNKIYRR